MERELTKTAAQRNRGKARKIKGKKKIPKPFEKCSLSSSYLSWWMLTGEKMWLYKCWHELKASYLSVYQSIHVFGFFFQKRKVFSLGVAHRAAPCWNVGSGAGWGVVCASTALSAELLDVEGVLADAGGNLSWADTVLRGSALHTRGYDHYFALKGW